MRARAQRVRRDRFLAPRRNQVDLARIEEQRWVRRAEQDLVQHWNDAAAPELGHLGEGMRLTAAVLHRQRVAGIDVDQWRRVVPRTSESVPLKLSDEDVERRSAAPRAGPGADRV